MLGLLSLQKGEVSFNKNTTVLSTCSSLTAFRCSSPALYNASPGFPMSGSCTLVLTQVVENNRRRISRCSAATFGRRRRLRCSFFSLSDDNVIVVLFVSSLADAEGQAAR